MGESILVSKSFHFSIEIVNLYKILVEKEKEYVLSKQLLRSGTAIGALVRESRNAESTLDFIHKLAIAQKECDETIYWLELLHATNYINKELYDNLSNLALELLKIIRSTIITCKQKVKN
ncbi:four helix bundle protein [Paludibacteraceae bacterium OttesenSCG-928-F17]|nr:four helix bundle protein [Paludibacteraceae bacterium OttesenSCG-928-F17]